MKETEKNGLLKLKNLDWKVINNKQSPYKLKRIHQAQTFSNKTSSLDPLLQSAISTLA